MRPQQQAIENMNNNNTVAQSAIAQINEERANAVKAAARLIILNIESAQKAIEQNKKNMKPYQDRVNASRAATYTQEQVLGYKLSDSPTATANELAIANVIDDMNDDRVKLVEENAKIDIAAINSFLASNAAMEATIATQRKQLAELKVTEVSADILG